MSSGLTRAAHVVRGALIGCAEAVPGVSGGTVALVTGVYEALINSAGHLISAVRALPTDRARARAEFAAVRWDVVIPVAIGMVPALLIALRFLGPALEEHPVPMRALFLGMVAASLVVPIRMIGDWWRPREVLVGVAAAVLAFFIAGAPQLASDPSLPLVFLAAAVAVCALTLPGVSGAFLLLIFGVYEAASAAVRNVDLAFIGVFVAGAIFGLSLFVKTLQWLLAHHRRITLVAMTGLMVGALRAMWPWQTEDRGLLAPQGQELLALALALTGAAVVLGIIWLERRAELRYLARQGVARSLRDTPAA